MCTCVLAECHEYCQFETFNASCSGEDQVVLMEEARYGRLRLGRCVTHDYGFLGCSSSVLDLLDRTCSGRRWCQFEIPLLRDLVHPCPKDLTCYLEATFRCVTGVYYGYQYVDRSSREFADNQSKITGLGHNLAVPPGCGLKMRNHFSNKQNAIIVTGMVSELRWN